MVELCLIIVTINFNISLSIAILNYFHYIAN